MKPVCICEYNEYMAEVDHLDQMTSYTAHISTAVNDQIFHFYDRSLKICRITNIAEIIISWYGAKSNSILVDVMEYDMRSTRTSIVKRSGKSNDVLFWLSVCIKLVKRIKCQITLMIVIVYFLRYHRFKIFEIADSAFFALLKPLSVKFDNYVFLFCIHFYQNQ